MVRCLST